MKVSTVDGFFIQNVQFSFCQLVLTLIVPIVYIINKEKK